MIRLVFALSFIVSCWSFPHEGRVAVEEIIVPKNVKDVGIVGGDKIDIRKTPYQVSVQLNGEHWCGGSLIAPDWVLTATHCFEDEEIRTLEVRVGSTTSNRGGQLITVEQRFEHPGFDMVVVSNDITLLKLSKKVKLSPSAAIIALATADPAAGSSAYVSGWGKTSENNNTLPVNLRGVEVKTISMDDCRQRYEGEEIFDYNICAFSKGKDSCQSDSGGPLAVKDTLVGIVSWGDGCAKGENPGVYTSVASYKDWVVDTMKKNS